MKPQAISNFSPRKASELILNSDGSLYHLGIVASDIADDVLVVGDPGRVSQISARFDKVEIRKGQREFHVHTGVLKGHRLTVISTGIGVDNIDIVVNELHCCVNFDLETRTPKSTHRSLNIIRLGTSGTMRENINVGDIVCSKVALGIDGVPWFYGPIYSDFEQEFSDAFLKQVDWPAKLATPYIVEGSQQLIERLASDKLLGVTFTANGFYGPQFRELNMPVAFPKLWEQIREFEFNGQQFTNFEMECAGLYALGSLLGHHVITLCVILANRRTGVFHDAPQVAISRLIDLALSRLTA